MHRTGDKQPWKEMFKKFKLSGMFVGKVGRKGKVVCFPVYKQLCCHMQCLYIGGKAITWPMYKCLENLSVLGFSLVNSGEKGKLSLRGIFSRVIVPYVSIAAYGAPKRSLEQASGVKQG